MKRGERMVAPQLQAPPPQVNVSASQLAALANTHPGMTEDWRLRYDPFISRVENPRAHAAPQPTPSWSFVVVTWRMGAPLLACLDRILSQRGLSRDQIELIVVNNGELEVDDEALRARADVLITMSLNVGCSTGRNVGAAWANAPLLSFIDDDGLVGLEYALNAARHLSDPAIVALRGRVIPARHPYFTTLAGHYDRGPHVIDEHLTAEGTMAIRRPTFITAGGFPEGMVGHEGLHLSYNILRASPRARIIYAPDVTLAHDYMQSWRHFVKKSTRYAGINSRPDITDPALAKFIADALAKKFARPRLSADKRIARTLLLATRKVLQKGAQLLNR